MRSYVFVEIIRALDMDFDINKETFGNIQVNNEGIKRESANGVLHMRKAKNLARLDRQFLWLVRSSLLTLRCGSGPHPCTLDGKGDPPSPWGYLSRFVCPLSGRSLSRRRLSADKCYQVQHSFIHYVLSHNYYNSTKLKLFRMVERSRLYNMQLTELSECWSWVETRWELKQVADEFF